MVKNYVNLTNGIEAIPHLQRRRLSFSFIRLQSTHCEQKLWEIILQELSDDLLMNLALGHTCVVWDYSSRNDESRACVQGCVWISYVLNRVWFEATVKPLVRGNDCSLYFEECFRDLSRRVTAKLKYYKKFLLADRIRLEWISKHSERKEDLEYYQGVMKELANE